MFIVCACVCCACVSRLQFFPVTSDTTLSVDTIISESVELVFSFSCITALEELIAKALQEGKEKFERVNGLKDTQELKDVL